MLTHKGGGDTYTQYGSINLAKLNIYFLYLKKFAYFCTKN